jgi:site-specific DNA-methyltransferase (adenine-specific)
MDLFSLEHCAQIPAPALPICRATGTLDLRLADCMDVMREFPDKHFDLAIVDPPYGAGDTIFDTSKVVANKTTKHAIKTWNNVVPDAGYWSELFRVSKNVIAWGGNYFSPHLPPSRGWIVWDKKYQGMHSFASAELAFSTFDRNAEMFSWRKPESKEHPCQKPVALYRWLLDNYADQGQRILDTHLGSGSHAIACHYAGMHLTACEIDADYYAAACARIARETAQMTLAPQ